MEALGAAADSPARVYFTGGATAVLLGWRPSTIDVEVKFLPDHDVVVPERALEYFERIEPELYRYPAIHGPSFRRAVEQAFRT